MSDGLVYDSSKTGLSAFILPWQQAVLKVIWESKTGLKSSEVHVKVGDMLKPETISRASVINFLEEMRKMGVLSGVEATGKGGYHWVYSAAMNESEFKRHAAETIIKSLKSSFPEETKEAIKRLTK